MPDPFIDQNASLLHAETPRPPTGLPHGPFPPPKLPPGVTLKPVFTTKVYCCPNK